MPLDSNAVIDALSQVAAYPSVDQARQVRVLHTHWSVLFFTDHHVYKLKRPIRRRFLNLATLAARRRNCDEEVRLNRRLAPDVYLGVAALVETPHGLRIETSPDLWPDTSLNRFPDTPTDTPLPPASHGRPRVHEWLVRMRRLPATRMLDQCIRDHCLHVSEIESLARVLLDFYERADQGARHRPTPVARSAPRDYPRTLRQRTGEHAHAVIGALEGLGPTVRRHVVHSCSAFLESDRVRALSEQLRQRLGAQAPALEVRAREGHLIEGHGDLRPEHVCLIDPPVIIDCLEFDQRLRMLDPVDELAYLGLECDLLGEPRVGEVLERCHVAATGDAAGWALAPVYQACRAFVRAHLAVAHLSPADLAARDSKNAARWLTATARYLAAGAAALEREPHTAGRPSSSRGIVPDRLSGSGSARLPGVPAPGR